MKKLLALFVIVLGFTAVSFGQATATASASGTIVSAMTLTKTGDLNFGNIASTTGGTVTVAPSGGATYGTGAAVYAVPGTITPAHFNVTGSPSATYSISAIAPITVVNAAGDDMTVTAFTTDPALLLGKLGTDGKQTINVGATLTLDATPVPGLYTSTTGFSVTVNYN